MSITIRICLVLVSILVFVFMMRRIQKEKLLIADAVFWIIFSLCLLILSVFPQIVIFFADLLGFYSAANLVMVVGIFILLVKLFSMSLHISHTECQLRQTIEELAIAEKRIREMEGKLQDNPEK